MDLIDRYFRRRFRGIALFCCLVLLSSVSALAQIPEKAEFGQFAITNATIYTISNGVIENGTILIDGRQITYVGTHAEADVTSDYETIDASGKYVYPGFMDSGTLLGLIEVEQVAVTNDQAEIGEFNPHVRALTAINPGSVSIPVSRVNGVTHVVSLPVSGRISGKATLFNLYGYTPDSMAVSENAALHLVWPSSYQSPFDNRPEEEFEEQYQANVKQLNEFWDRAVFYHNMMSTYEIDPANKTQPAVDRKMEAMREVVSGEVPVIVSVDRDQDILNALEWIGEHREAEFILAGVSEGWRVADKIAGAEVPCVVSTLYTPVRDNDNYQRPYQNPGMLHNAGVKVAIASGSAENVRNLPYHAGYAATYGLGRDEALKAITLNAAEIFGVSDRLGSLETGKLANLFIADGDPFEPMTHIEQVFIAGNKIPMESRHTKLYEEFLNRGAVSN